MNIIKRSGKVEQLTKKKIFDSICNANSCVKDEEKLSQKQIRRITDSVVAFCENLDEPIEIDILEDVIEKKIMEAASYEVAKRYITYRYEKERVRMNKSLTEKLTASNVQNQNANVDEFSFGGRIGETAGYVTKQYALDHLISAKTKHNHNNNEIYIHDLDSYAVGSHNCLSIPFDKLLKEGFNTRQTDVRPASSINTAMQLVAVIFQLQSLQQFGGVSATHIDWTMVPYVRKSFLKHYKDGKKYIRHTIFEQNDENPIIIKEGGIPIDNLCFTNDKEVYEYAMEKTTQELEQAVEGMYHNLNTLQSRSGNQLPFTSINYGTCTLPEGRMVTKALIEGCIKGCGKFHTTSIFPCGIFQCMKGVNRKEGEPNYDLFKLALKSTAMRIYPNYANVDWSGNEGYDRDNPSTYFSTMGCHAKDTKIVMSDGSKKNVQDIIIGDKIMGINNSIRTVQSLIRGNDTLFKIEQSRGESYTVNEGHILSLMYSSSKKYKNFKKGDIVNMSVHDFIEIPEHTRRFFKGYKCGYELSEKDFDIPPYILGLWLGDGNSSSTVFSVKKDETKILEDLKEYAELIGKKANISNDKDEFCYRVSISNRDTANEGNKLRRALINYGILNDKKIPECYFYGSIKQRKELLAGLINTDGWRRVGRGRQTVCFGNTNLNLINGVCRLANSIGLTTNVIKAIDMVQGIGICRNSTLKPYYHVSIHRFDDSKLMENKRTNIDNNSIRNFSTSTLKVTKLDKGDFYGFELDGDRLYLINDCTVTHNCRTANGWDINCDDPKLGQLKDGRGNICPTTIIMPTIAMQAKDKAEKNKSDIVEEFMKLLEKKIGEAKDSLIERFDWICSQPSASAKFMYENGTMYGYKPEEGIKSALKHGTLAIGQLGLAETLQILIGCDHTTKKGMELAKRIESLFKEKCAKYKKEYKLNFGVYYTPAENLCFTAMKKFKEVYGEIKNVSDHDYFTNSMHIPVWYKLDPFTKIDLESQLTPYSSAGCITYVEMDASVKNNINAMEELVNYAMDKDIPYFAINVPIDTCECGYQGDLGEKCPKCGSTNIQRLRRVTGYITGNYTTAFNPGKQSEVEQRTKHTGIEVK